MRTCVRDRPRIPHTRFRRALASRDPLIARAAAAELPRITLLEALELTLLLAERDPERFERAAVRWHAHFCLEVRGLRADEAALALTAMLSLAGRSAATGASALCELCEQRGQPALAEVLADWAERHS